MKKTIKVLSMFLFLFSVFFVMQINDNNKVKGITLPSGYQCTKGTTLCKASTNTTILAENLKYGDNTNNVVIHPNGSIDVTIQYGYTEFLIVYEKCSSVNKNEDGSLLNTCGGEFKVDKIVLKSGYVNSSGTKTFVFAPPSDYITGDMLRISVLTSFMTNQIPNGDAKNPSNYKGQYEPAYCSSSDARCKKGQQRVNVRVNDFLNDLNVKVGDDQIVYDSSKVIYKGTMTTPNRFFVMANIVTQVSNDGDENVANIISQTIVPVLLAVLGVLAIVTSVTLGYQIVKSADEPGERSEKVKKLRNIIIGLAAVAVVLLAYEPVYELVKKWITNQR